MPTLKTITGTFTGPDGVPVPCQVKAVLSQPCTVPGTQEVIDKATRVFSDPVTAAFSLPLYANNDLTPTNTYYTVTAVGMVDSAPVVGTWVIVVPQSAGPFEISTILALTPPVPQPPGALDAQVVHLALPETITGVKVYAAGAGPLITGPGPWIDPQAFAGVDPTGATDSTTGLQNAHNAVPAGGADVLYGPGPSGVALYKITAPLVYKGGSRIRAAGSAMNGTVTIRVANGANITAPGGVTAIFVPAEWNTNQTFSGNPVIIENFCLDGNKANNGSGQMAGIILYNFWARAQDNYILNTNLYGVLMTDTARNGSSTQANGASEIRVLRNHLAATGSTAIRQIIGGSAQGALDGFCDDNTIDSPGVHGIQFDAAAGWSIRRNHGYGIQQHFIYAPKCFATVIANNDTDDFGLQGTAAATYYGIYVTSVPGAKPSRGGHVHDNSLDCTEAGGSANYHYYWVDDANVTGTAHMTIHDNTGRYSGAGTSIGTLLTLNAQAATWIYEEHNNVGLNLANGKRVLITGTGQVRRRPLIPSARPASGQYLTTPFNNIVTVQLVTLNGAIFVPVDVASEQTFTGISFNLNTVGTGAGQVARLALFGDDGTFTAPAGSPIEDLGTTSTLATTGNRDVAFAAARKLLPARYWLAVVIQGAITLGPTLTSTNSGQDIALPQTTLDNSVQARCWSQSGVSGAFGAVASLFGTSASPMLALKAQ